MSENLQDVNAQPSVAPEQGQQPAQPVQPTLTPQQFEAIKSSLIQNLVKAYQAFIHSIANFPASSHAMQESFRHFDTGFLWFEKAIVTMPMPNMQVMQTPQPQAASPEATPPQAETAPEANEAPTEAVAS